MGSLGRDRLDVGIAGGFALGIASTRAYYVPAHFLFLWPQPRAASYRCHPVAWDDLCSVPFIGLSRLLAAYAELDRSAREREIDRLIDSYPSQRMEALKARAILIAADAARETEFGPARFACRRTSRGREGFLRDAPRVKAMIGEIALEQRRLGEITIPAMREPLIRALLSTIESFRSSVGGFGHPLSQGFRAAAAAWSTVARSQYEEARRVLEATPVAEVFRAGDPVDDAREAFVARMAVIQELQSQATLGHGCPGLLLYGRRRTGKSTLIRNVEKFLPTSVAVTSISLQDPRAFTSLGSLTELLAKTVSKAVPGLGVAAAEESLTSLFDHLGRANEALQARGRRLIIAVDEYENIDAKIGDGTFPRELLDAFRESVQRHRQLVWLFAGSHDLSELEHAEWPSYFVSIRTIELGPFSADETRLLLTDPMRHSAIFGDDGQRRPRFDLAFWTEDGIDRIQGETAGWPHLVQLLAEGVVQLVNLRGLRAATPALLDGAIAKAVVRGDAVLRQLVAANSAFPANGTISRRSVPASCRIRPGTRRSIARCGDA